MKVWQLSTLVGAICLLDMFVPVRAQEVEPKQIESTELKQTIITPVMEVPIVPGKNLIYCSTFQIAWNMLQDSIIGEKIRMVDQPEVVDLLNKQLSTVNDISNDCYVAMVDTLTQEFLDRINRALKDKFGDNAPPKVVEEIKPQVLGFLAYTYLFKSLQFPLEFDRHEYGLSFMLNGKYFEVEAFGIPGGEMGERLRELRRHVQVLEYKSDSEFIVGLESSSPQDEIILAKIPAHATLLSAIAEVDSLVRLANPTYLQIEEYLGIPVFEFNVKHTFQEFIGRHFLNESWCDWYIKEAIQWIRFKMDEKGVVLMSEARLIIEGEDTRTFEFSPPFLVYLKQKGAKYPYFAMWVDNAELMVKYEQ